MLVMSVYRIPVWLCACSSCDLPRRLLQSLKVLKRSECGENIFTEDIFGQYKDNLLSNFFSG